MKNMRQGVFELFLFVITLLFLFDFENVGKAEKLDLRVVVESEGLDELDRLQKENDAEISRLKREFYRLEKEKDIVLECLPFDKAQGMIISEKVDSEEGMNIEKAIKDKEVNQFKEDADVFEQEVFEGAEHVITEPDKRKGSAITKLEKMKLDFSDRLENEIGEDKVRLDISEKTLIITFLAEVFFDSGDVKMRQGGVEILKGLAESLNIHMPDSFIAIEGYTDGMLERKLKWKSNWEISSARALAALHYLVDECEIEPERLSAAGYGEYTFANFNNNLNAEKPKEILEILIMPLKEKQ